MSVIKQTRGFSFFLHFYNTQSDFSIKIKKTFRKKHDTIGRLNSLQICFKIKFYLFENPGENQDAIEYCPVREVILVILRHIDNIPFIIILLHLKKKN